MLVLFSYPAFAAFHDIPERSFKEFSVEGYEFRYTNLNFYISSKDKKIHFTRLKEQSALYMRVEDFWVHLTTQPFHTISVEEWTKGRVFDALEQNEEFIPKLKAIARDIDAHNASLKEARERRNEEHLKRLQERREYEKHREEQRRQSLLNDVSEVWKNGGSLTGKTLVSFLEEFDKGFGGHAFVHPRTRGTLHRISSVNIENGRITSYSYAASGKGVNVSSLYQDVKALLELHQDAQEDPSDCSDEDLNRLFGKVESNAGL